MRKLTFFVSLIVISSLGLLACGKKTEVKYVEVEKVKPLACAKQNDYSLADNRVIQMDEITFDRVKQRVVRYNCDGTIKSNKIETNVYDKIDYLLYSVKQIKGDDRRVERKLNRISGKAYNRQTCNTAKRDPLSVFTGIIFEPFVGILNKVVDRLNGARVDRPSITMTLDYAPAVFTTEVNRGVQLIDYTFTKECRQKTSYQNGYRYSTRAGTRSSQNPRANDQKLSRRKDCKKVFEQGTLVLAVTYKDRDSNKTRFVKPENCK